MKSVISINKIRKTLNWKKEKLEGNWTLLETGKRFVCNFIFGPICYSRLKVDQTYL